MGEVVCASQATLYKFDGQAYGPAVSATVSVYR